MDKGLSNLLSELALARQDEKDATVERRAMFDKFTASPEYTELTNAAVAISGYVAELEKQLREYGTHKFNQDGEKKNDGYTVAITIQVELKDKPRLFDWCLTHFAPALTFDIKELDKAARSGKLPPEYYETKEVPQIRIVSDLSAFISPENDAE